MNGRDKLKAMLEQKTVDFIGVSGWMHTPDIDREDPILFAERIIKMTDANKWDFIKIMHNAWYVPDAYGADIKFYTTDIPLEYQRIKRLGDPLTPYIKGIEDMENLKVISEDNPVVQFNAEVIRILADHYKGTVPIIATIFTPACLMPDLCGGSNAKFLEYTALYPDSVHKALKSILETDKNLINAFAKAGADGFFIACKHSNKAIISPEGFDSFCAPYDIPLCEYANTKGWFNILHAHGQTDIYMDKFVKYPVQAINWENIPHGQSGPGVTTVQKLRSMTDKILIGGTDQFYDFYGTKEEVTTRFRERLETAARESLDNRFIFAPGCSLPLDVPEENIAILQKTVEIYNSRRIVQPY